MHLPLSVLLPLVPNALHQQMRDSRFYSNRFEAITVQADGSRKQTDNVDECFRKLYDVIAEVGRAAIPGLTSATQKARVQQLYADPASYIGSFSLGFSLAPMLTCCLSILDRMQTDIEDNAKRRCRAPRSPVEGVLPVQTIRAPGDHLPVLLKAAPLFSHRYPTHSTSVLHGCHTQTPSLVVVA